MKEELIEKLIEARGQRAYFASKCNTATFRAKKEDEAQYEKWRAVQEELEYILKQF